MNETFFRQKLYEESTSLAFYQLHHWLEESHRIAAQISRHLPMHIYVNLYISPPARATSSAATAAFQAHTDQEHSMILQVQGTKRWHVAPRPMLPYESLEARAVLYDGGEARASDIVTERELRALVPVTLQPGDALFVKAGTVHWAESVDAHSVSEHLTVSIALQFRHRIAGGLALSLFGSPFVSLNFDEENALNVEDLLYFVLICEVREAFFRRNALPLHYEFLAKQSKEAVQEPQREYEAYVQRMRRAMRLLRAEFCSEAARRREYNLVDEYLPFEKSGDSLRAMLSAARVPNAYEFRDDVDVLQSAALCEALDGKRLHFDYRYAFAKQVHFYAEERRALNEKPFVENLDERDNLKSEVNAKNRFGEI